MGSYDTDKITLDQYRSLLMQTDTTVPLQTHYRRLAALILGETLRSPGRSASRHDPGPEEAEREKGLPEFLNEHGVRTAPGNVLQTEKSRPDYWRYICKFITFNDIPTRKSSKGYFESFCLTELARLGLSHVEIDIKLLLLTNLGTTSRPKSDISLRQLLFNKENPLTLTQWDVRDRDDSDCDDVDGDGIEIILENNGEHAEIIRNYYNKYVQKRFEELRPYFEQMQSKASELLDLFKKDEESIRQICAGLLLPKLKPDALECFFYAFYSFIRLQSIETKLLTLWFSRLLSFERQRPDGSNASKTNRESVKSIINKCENLKSDSDGDNRFPFRELTALLNLKEHLEGGLPKNNKKVCKIVSSLQTYYSLNEEESSKAAEILNAYGNINTELTTFMLFLFILCCNVTDENTRDEYTWNSEIWSDSIVYAVRYVVMGDSRREECNNQLRQYISQCPAPLNGDFCISSQVYYWDDIFNGKLFKLLTDCRSPRTYARAHEKK